MSSQIRVQNLNNQFEITSEQMRMLDELFTRYRLNATTLRLLLFEFSDPNLPNTQLTNEFEKQFRQHFNLQQWNEILKITNWTNINAAFFEDNLIIAYVNPSNFDLFHEIFHFIIRQTGYRFRDWEDIVVETLMIDLIKPTQNDYFIHLHSKINIERYIEEYNGGIGIVRKDPSEWVRFQRHFLQRFYHYLVFYTINSNQIDPRIIDLDIIPKTQHLRRQIQNLIRSTHNNSSQLQFIQIPHKNKSEDEI